MWAQRVGCTVESTVWSVATVSLYSTPVYCAGSPSRVTARDKDRPTGLADWLHVRTGSPQTLKPQNSGFGGLETEVSE